MIKVEVDEAYAFDMLAIAELKSNISRENAFNYVKLYGELCNELGSNTVYNICRSQEYKNLYEANNEVFGYVEELNNGNTGISGLEVHCANMDRYKYKRELQLKFFHSQLTEQKTKKLT